MFAARFIGLLAAPFARRFVAGETTMQAVQTALKMNHKGIMAILDYLGEDVTSKLQAQAATEEYLALLKQIHDHEARASVSLKLSQMGLLISRDLCLANVRRIAEEASR